MGRKINRKKTYRKKTNRRKISCRKTNRRKNTRRITNMKRRRNIRKKYRGGSPITKITMPAGATSHVVVRDSTGKIISEKDGSSKLLQFDVGDTSTITRKYHAYNEDFRSIANGRPTDTDVKTREAYFETKFKPKFLEFIDNAFFIENTEELLELCKICSDNTIHSQKKDAGGKENAGIFLDSSDSIIYKLVKFDDESFVTHTELCAREWYYSLVGYNNGIAPNPILIYICKTSENGKMSYFIIMSYEKKEPYSEYIKSLEYSQKSEMLQLYLKVINESTDKGITHGDTHVGNVVYDTKKHQCLLIDWAHAKEMARYDWQRRAD